MMTTRRVDTRTNGDHKHNGKQNGAATKSKQSALTDEHEHEHEHDDHTHSHSHSLFSSHTHSRDDESRQAVAAALHGQSRRDPGSRITIIGLIMNVGLTASKGAAGWFMNSAALLAEAGHSLSDLLGDFVTLACWNLSRKPPSQRYPYGFGKFETVGTTMVSIILIGGALGIGFHSYALLMHHLVDTASSLPPGTAQTILQNVTEVAQNITGPISSLTSSHGHAHAHVLDPNAAWFAGISVLAKEWLYRATKRVADDERSSVLLANAIHHRSDAYSSLVALVAILGTWYFPTLPLDPIGGLVVSLVILRQGIALLGGAFGELTDAGVSVKTHRSLERALAPLLASSTSAAAEPNVHAIRDLRAMRSGALMFVDLTVYVPPQLSVHDASALEGRVRDTLVKARKEIYEVRIKFLPADDDGKDVTSQ
ncbi:hypothetical protein BD410DRAFT_784193 [Rickenella mellea]|uniref:Uncharacterized protein n=1 Tax=Rickenella mellea TaxID=50990 RepID=A0A4Y7QG25_9AGAM|nr:hypothetical protein BD410DRAFT_784193 [Rickenella mellea]